MVVLPEDADFICIIRKLQKKIKTKLPISN